MSNTNRSAAAFPRTSVKARHEFASRSERDTELNKLVGETRRALLLSDYMYAMAALPLALEPIQKIRFIPYAHQRFHKFQLSWETEYG